MTTSPSAAPDAAPGTPEAPGTPQAPGRFADAGPLRIHYQDSGLAGDGPAGPPTLLLSGWTCSGLLWPGAFTDALTARLRVLRVCNRGTGHSSPAADPFTLADLAADAVAVLDAAGIGRANVVGWSMGGMIAEQLAMDHPDRVDRLVLVASAPPSPAYVPPTPEALLPMLTPLPEDRPMSVSVRERWAYLTGPGWADGNPAVLDRLTEASLTPATALEVIGAQFNAIANWEGSERLAAVDHPALVLHGDADLLVPTANGHLLADLLPDARLRLFPGAGHLLPWEATDEVARLAVEFLAGDRP